MTRPMRGKYLPKLVLSLAVAAVFVWLLREGALPVVPHDAAAFDHVERGGIAVAALVWLAGYVCRAGRWYWLLAPLRRTRRRVVLPLSFAGIAVLIALPLRAGELVRVVMIERTTEISFWEATGTAGAERIVDGLTVSLMLFAGLVFAHPLDPLPDHIGKLAIPTRMVAGAAYAALVAFASAFSVMVLFYVRRAWSRRVTERALGMFSPKLARSVADRLALVADGLSFLSSPSVSVPFVLATLAHWASLAGSLLLIGRATGFADLGVAEAGVVIGAVTLGVLVPSAPGYFGTFQLSVYAALALYHPTRDVIGHGSVFVLFLYLLQIGAPVLLGAIALGLVPAARSARPP